MKDVRRRFPPWFLGLVLAVIVFIVALIIFAALGYGDDPVLGRM